MFLSIICGMQNIKEFLKSNKYAFIWTICYVVVVWAVMQFMFGFDIFSARHWHLLSRISLHGFASFVFGLLLISAVPLYVATTAIIVRTKKPLITLPNILPAKKDAQKKSDDVAPESESSEQPLPADLPRELYEPFLRARAHGAGWAFQNFDMPNVQEANDKPAIPDEPDLPLPPDFDIEPERDLDTDSNFLSEMPVFSEVNFDDDKSGN